MAHNLASGFTPDDPRWSRLQPITQRYEISQAAAARIRILENCEVVILVDDSGSMNMPLQGSSETRWDEMRRLVTIISELAVVMDSNGVDIYFLNRPPVLNVTDARLITQEFSKPPQGLTPIAPALRQILAAKRAVSYEKKLLIFIATDGAPTDEQGNPSISALETILRNERTPQTYVSFLACTDNLQDVAYLSNWDRNLPNVDVIDDYRSERTEIQRTLGSTYPFSFGDYIVKALLGAVDPWFDTMDNRA